MQASNATTNGTYGYDQSTKRAYLTILTIATVFCLVLSFLGAREQHFAPGIWMLLIGFAVISICYIIQIVIASTQTIEMNDLGIFLRDQEHHEIQALRWAELNRVSERRQLGQLALWDRNGVRRILIDQQWEKFPSVRSRILNEYAKVFIPKPLPTNFRTGFVIYYETVIYMVIIAFWAWIAWISQRQGQRGALAFFVGFMGLTFYLLLKLYPQLGGPSTLFEDRLVLRSLFTFQEIFKRDVANVEIADVKNQQSGTKFSSVVLRMVSGKDVKISYRYGNIPEMYLTLRAWLSR